MNHAIYFRLLFALLLLFIFRVVAQSVQAIYPIRYLPSFDAWHSDALPYPVLVFSLLVIIALFAWVVWQFFRASSVPNRRWGKLWLRLAALYITVTILRLLAGMTFATDHHWFGATIPTIFHLVLAGFVLIYADFHYRYGEK